MLQSYVCTHIITASKYRKQKTDRAEWRNTKSKITAECFDASVAITNGTDKNLAGKLSKI